MELGTAVLIAAVVVFLGVVILLLWRPRRDAEDRAVRQDLGRLVESQAQTAAQVAQLAHLVTQQLGQVTQQLQSGVAVTGQLASEAQRAVAAQLKASTEMLGTIRQQLGEVQQAGRDLSDAARTIESVLGGARTRGALGEVALERLLEDSLPRANFETQYRFSTGAVVDAILRVGERLVCVDSKFPLDAYRRLIECDEESQERLRKEFARAVRSHVDSIASKYILPGEATLDYAFMFIPSEGVYYELIRKYRML